jgi:bacteriophage exclusion system BrxA-like protein
MTNRFTSNIQKGGALLDDARRLVEVWDLDRSAEDNLSRIAGENLLAKTSRARADDVLLRILRPRLVDPGPQVIAALKELLEHPVAFRAACYYEASRVDALLAAFAEGPLADRYDAGRVTINIHDTVDWLLDLEKDGQVRAWSDTIRMKVARGLLAALRDFGILTGAVRKEIAAPSITVHGFAYTLSVYTNRARPLVRWSRAGCGADGYSTVDGSTNCLDRPSTRSCCAMPRRGR